ncbi:MAG: CvpA family protein [Dehalococcoidia bacterium]|nr:CvpA family protein [Dehalococcoidia bacterium]
MNWVDIVIIVVVIGFAISGLSQGAVRTVVGLIGLVAGIVVAGQLYRELSVWLFGSPQEWGPIVAWLVIFAAVNIVAAIIGWVLARLVKMTLLGWVDKLLGLVIGGVVGLLTCAALLAVVMKYLPASDSVIAGSTLAAFLLDKLPLVLALLPPEFSSIRDFFATPRSS